MQLLRDRGLLTGGSFPVGLNSLRLDSPWYLLVKPGFLKVLHTSHQYLSGAAISPPACIHRTLRPNDLVPTCIGSRVFHSFHLCASWRTYVPHSSPRRATCTAPLQMRITPPVYSLASREPVSAPVGGLAIPVSERWGLPSHPTAALNTIPARP